MEQSQHGSIFKEKAGQFNTNGNIHLVLDGWINSKGDPIYAPYLHFPPKWHSPLILFSQVPHFFTISSVYGISLPLSPSLPSPSISLQPFSLSYTLKSLRIWLKKSKESLEDGGGGKEEWAKKIFCSASRMWGKGESWEHTLIILFPLYIRENQSFN